MGTDTRAPTASLAAHALLTLRLALPVMVGRAGILTMVAVDTAMTGHAGGTELAFYALGLAPQLPIVLVGIGLLMGTVVLTGEADGAGRFEIAIGTTPLFHTFRENQPSFVGGRKCHNRLDALQRIMEHEMIHLTEMLIWKRYWEMVQKTSASVACKPHR